MKKLMVVILVVAGTVLHAQSMRMSPGAFAVETIGSQFGMTPSGTSLQTNFFDQTSNTSAGFAGESLKTSRTFGVVGGDTRPANIVVQEDLVAGKKAEELGFIRKMLSRILIWK